MTIERNTSGHSSFNKSGCLTEILVVTALAIMADATLNRGRFLRTIFPARHTQHVDQDTEELAQPRLKVTIEKRENERSH